MGKTSDRRVLAARALIDDGRFGDAAALLTSEIVAASAAQDPLREACARGLVAQAQLLDGQPKVARRHAERGLAIAHSLGDDDGAAFFSDLLQRVDAAVGGPSTAQLLGRGRAALEDRALDESIRCLEAAITGAAAAGDDRSEATARGLLSQALARGGQWQAALPQADRAFELARQHGNRSAVAWFREQVGRIKRQEVPQVTGPRFSEEIASVAEQARRGQVRAALSRAQMLLEEAQAEGARGPQASLHHLLAQLCQQVGVRAQAFVHATEGEAIAKTLEDDAAVEVFRRLVDALSDA